MIDLEKLHRMPRHIDRRTLLGSAAAGMLAASLGGRDAGAAIGGDDEIAHWTPDYVNTIAGTAEVRYRRGMREGRAA